MSGPARIDIGAWVTCRNDNPVGHLKQVVADLVAGCLTHLVDGPALRQDGDRLVPIGMAHMADSVVVLSCDTVGFRRLAPAVETEFITASLDESGYGPEETYLWPNYGLSAGGMGTRGFRLSARAFNGNVGHDIVTDQVSSGDFELRRGRAVIATDGPIGRPAWADHRPSRCMHHPPAVTTRPSVGSYGSRDSVGLPHEDDRRRPPKHHP